MQVSGHEGHAPFSFWPRACPQARHDRQLSHPQWALVAAVAGPCLRRASSDAHESSILAEVLGLASIFFASKPPRSTRALLD
jgi:hypothetical protein